jgi:glycosyltransferase A (GT-A) superfamily protein (DUF2064 family)
VNIGIAIFVKTPGFSPVKTRLARTHGQEYAENWYRRAAVAVAEVAILSGASVYWAVGEPEAMDAPLWQSMARICQVDTPERASSKPPSPRRTPGPMKPATHDHNHLPLSEFAQLNGAETAANSASPRRLKVGFAGLMGPGVRRGDVRNVEIIRQNDAQAGREQSGPTAMSAPQTGLGARMHNVHAQLLARHDAGILLGADLPHLDLAVLRAVAAYLVDDHARRAIAPALDGGFWLYGANRSAPLAIWESVPYSSNQTLLKFNLVMQNIGVLKTFASATDVDTGADLNACADALAQLDQPTPAQRDLLKWMREIAEPLN